jgi:hypothetical protein
MKCIHCEEPAEWIDKYCQEHWEAECSRTWWEMVDSLPIPTHNPQSPTPMKSLFLVFILFSGIILSLQILLNLAVEIAKLTGKAAIYLPTLSPAQVAMSMSVFGVATATQYWWLTVV